jgi:hypothetical protein
MKLTKEISDKINKAWQYGGATSCQFAMSQLDHFVNTLINGGSIQIEEDNLIIHDFSEFLVWKNKKWIFQQISVCNRLNTSEKIDLINKIVPQFNLTRVKFTEIDPNNHYFNLKLKNETGEFQIYLGKLINMDDIPAYTINVKSLDFKKKLELIVEFENGKKTSFQFQSFEIK